MMRKEDVIKAIERRNPPIIPVWDDYFSLEILAKHGDKLVNIMSKYEQSFLLVEFRPPLEQQVREFGKPVPYKGQLGWTAKKKNAMDSTLPMIGVLNRI